MMGLTEMWKLLNGSAERAAAARNIEAHAAAQGRCALDDDLDWIDRLMRRQAPNGRDRTDKPASR
jgi:hypothetical protein